VTGADHDDVEVVLLLVQVVRGDAGVRRRRGAGRVV